MSYEINLRLRRFGPGTAHPNRPNSCYIRLPVPYAARGSETPRPHDLVNTGKLHGPEGIRAGIITMDLGATVCITIDRLVRGPD